MSSKPIFGAATLLVLAAAGARAQSTPANPRLQPTGAAKPSAAIPASAPTTILPAPASPAPAAPPAPTVRRAKVDYRDGLLTITAANSSLNQILREIARQTGIEIAGGVTDEHVFGTYGPLDLPAMLTMLLSGTGSNMMLSGADPTQPRLLTLTPRQGGVSPPSPQQSAANEDPDEAERNLPPQLTPRTSQAPGPPSQAEAPPQPRPFTPPAATDATQPTATTTTETSPNGVKTPQQIYDQLMKLQQQAPRTPQ